MVNNQEVFSKDQAARSHLKSLGIDPQIIFPLIIKNWYFFLITIILSVIGAKFYIDHTMPIYLSSTTILIETGERQAVNNEELLQGLGLSGGMRNLDNQIKILTSRGLTERALKELSFEVEFYHKTIRNQLPIYPITPLKINFSGEMPLPKDIEFSIKYLGNNMFIIKSEAKEFGLEKTVSFNDTINLINGRFSISCLDEEWLEQNMGSKLYFVVHSSAGLINFFNSRIEIELVSRTGSILKLSLAGTNKQRDVDFLNKLAEVFQAISLDKKNNEAIRRIQFIDDQLIGISDSLQITESKLQQFRSSHKVMDLSVQGQSIIEQITILENEKGKLSLEANYYDYLADYLAKDIVGELPLVPITMGITDPGLTRLVTELADLQGQLTAKSTGEKNPLQNLLAQKVRNTKEALLETLNGLRRANSLARSENQDRINKVNSQASALPVTERQLLGIERKFKLNDEMYTFLLETRAEQQMQKASNTADSEVVDPADTRFSMIISPNKNMVYLIAIFLGFGIPLTIVFFRSIFDKKLKEEDIPKLVQLPILGNIPHNNEASSTVTFDSPSSSIAEAYRLMRSKMQFFTKDAKSPVILITSSMPGEGKTFTAINLASVYSMLGKKTILVGFDLRKPKIYNDFNLSNEKGVSTYLIGKDNLEGTIQKTNFENLSILSAGPVPPNPSELTALKKTSEMIERLKETFDVIIIDSSPIGIVSDAYHLASLADACVLVIRPGMTLRDMLGTTMNEITINGTKGLSLVVNDVKSANLYYKYGDKFGYTSEEKKTRKSFFKRLIRRRT